MTKETLYPSPLPVAIIKAAMECGCNKIILLGPKTGVFDSSIYMYKTLYAVVRVEEDYLSGSFEVTLRSIDEGYTLELCLHSDGRPCGYTEYMTRGITIAPESEEQAEFPQRDEQAKFSQEDVDD